MHLANLTNAGQTITKWLAIFADSPNEGCPSSKHSLDCCSVHVQQASGWITCILSFHVLYCLVEMDPTALDCIFPHCMYRCVDIFLPEMMSVQHGAAEQRHGKRHALESAPSSD